MKGVNAFSIPWLVHGSESANQFTIVGNGIELLVTLRENGDVHIESLAGNEVTPHRHVKEYGVTFLREPKR